FISAFAVSGGMNSQERNRDQSGALGNVLFGSATGYHNIQIRVGSGSEPFALRIGHDTHKIRTLQSGASPEKPAFGIAGEVAELNVVVCRGLQHATLPSGDGHGGTTQPERQLHLAEAVALAQRGDSLSPVGNAILSSSHLELAFCNQKDITCRLRCHGLGLLFLRIETTER